MGVRAFLLSTDAIIAVGLLFLLGIMIASISLTPRFPYLSYQRLYANARDTINIIEYARMSSIRDMPVVQQYLSLGILSEEDMNKTILDVIGALWARGNITQAGNLTKAVLDALLPSKYGYEVLMDNIVLTKRGNQSGTVARLATIVSGYSIGKPVSGYVASAYLSRFSKINNAYLYFGGYVGDGNINATLSLPADAIPLAAYIEVSAGSDFQLYINGNYAGTFSANGSDMFANVKANIIPSLFVGGVNNISINFTSNQSRFIGGGFIRVTYNTTMAENIHYAVLNNTIIDRQYMPSVNGVINLYSSFYVPGTLRNLSAKLHYNNRAENSTIFFSVGNVTLYESDQTGTFNILLNASHINSTLAANNASLNSLSNKTVPFRFGTHAFNITFVGNADVILVTDVSGSMGWRLDRDGVIGIDRDCDDPKLLDPDTSRISLAKCLDKQFINITLSAKGNRVGLVAYSGLPNFFGTSNSVIIRSYHNLTDNITSLINQVDSYTANGATGLCGAIRKARIMLQQQSNESRQKYIIAMTDGLSNVQCSVTDENNTNGCIPRSCPDETFCEGGGCLYRVAYDAGTRSAPTIAFNVSGNGEWWLIVGKWDGRFDGFVWKEIKWVPNSSIVSGLGDVGYSSAPTIGFNVTGSGKWELISGNYYGKFYGYYWNGVQWVSDSSIVNGLGDVGYYSKPSLVFNLTGNNRWNLITGERYGKFYGYYWNGVQWVSDSSIVNGLGDVGSHSAPTITFNLTGDNKYVLIAGEYTGVFNGYYWENGQWNVNSTLISGLGDVGYYSTPSIGFNVTGDGNFYLITGEYYGNYYSYEWFTNSWLRICGDYVSDRAVEDAINDTVRARNYTRAVINSIGFGPIAYCPFAVSSLMDIAKAGNGSYCASNDPNILQNCYVTFASEIVNISYTAQTIELSGAASIGTLYHDSYIEYEYVPIKSLGYGEVSITKEEARFGGNVSSPKVKSYNIVDAHVIDAKLTSYSSKYWTFLAGINSSRTGYNWVDVYRLTSYGANFSILGDPYIVQIPPNLVASNETNFFRLDTALSPYNTTGGSPDARLIYSVAVNGIVGYGNVFNSSELAIEDAKERLRNKVAKYNITALDIITDTEAMKNVPSLWGPAVFEIKIWV